ncbi:MAG: hypothetical protein A3I31_01280 [Candidatus Colwellbacteria bacterium RIFCSPLOWO2_02_FULL_44_20b]|nr:MAG: hypothetical protein A3I31_01280 [Candidatus Colwellbacteria bacterium RIFCSPLOWO2_02_FULL_44_20b]
MPPLPTDKNKLLPLFLIFVVIIGLGAFVVYKSFLRVTPETKQAITSSNASKVEKIASIPQEAGRFYISPDNSRVVYEVSSNEGKDLLIVDGVEYGPYDEIIEVVFSPNSRRTAWMVERANEMYVVINGKEKGPYNSRGSEYDFEGNLIFSPDGTHLAYEVLENNNFFVFVDDNKEGPYQAVRSKIFSANSQKLAYIATNQGESFVVVNGSRKKSYDSIEKFLQSEDLIFSSGDKPSYIVRQDEETYLVVGEKEKVLLVDNDDITTFTVSNDGQKFAYVAYQEEISRKGLLLLKKGYYVAIGSLESEEDIDGYFGPYGVDALWAYSTAWNLQFSPNSQQLAYFAVYEGEAFPKTYISAFTIRDLNNPAGTFNTGHPYVFEPPHAAAGSESYNELIWSGDSQKLAYSVKAFGDESYREFDIGGLFVVMDTEVNQTETRTGYYNVKDLVFSHDGRYLAYIAEEPSYDSKQFVVLNNEPKQAYEKIYNPYFTEDDNYLIYVARNGDEFSRVVEEIK